jgi:hypothetical protein
MRVMGGVPRRWVAAADRLEHEADRSAYVGPRGQPRHGGEGGTKARVNILSDVASRLGRHIAIAMLFLVSTGGVRSVRVGERAGHLGGGSLGIRSATAQ